MNNMSFVNIYIIYIIFSMHKVRPYVMNNMTCVII